MASREAIFAVTEGSYGTVTANAVLNTSSFYFSCPDSDCFQAVMTPVFLDVPYGGGINIPLEARADHYNTQIAWKGLVYPSVDNFLINLALQRITSAPLPWTTTEPVGDLASASLYKYWVTRASATPVRKRYPGCKVQTLTISASRQDPLVRFNATLVAQKEIGNTVDSSSDPDATEFPAPTDAQLPTGSYLFSHSSSNLSVGGSAVTNYLSVELKVENDLDVLHFETKYPSVVAFTGRRISCTFTRLLSSSPNYRNFFQGITDKATYLKFDNGSNSFKVDMGDSCHITAYATSLGLGKEFLETITLRARYNTSANTDCALTFT